MSDESTVSTHRPHETDEEEFARLITSIDDGLMIPVELDPASAAAVVASVQLALRHPSNGGHTAKVGRRLCDGLIDMLARYCDEPERMRKLLNRGYDPNHDAPARQDDSPATPESSTQVDGWEDE